jgi:hypothetical protein
MKRFFNPEIIMEQTNAYLRIAEEYEERKEKDREEFLNLLLDDEAIKNNRALQEKYMELYDKYTGRHECNVQEGIKYEEIYFPRGKWMDQMMKRFK